jgi:alpha-mannosidase
VRVEITQARGWAITSFLWKGSQGDVEMVPRGQAANELVFYQDGGGLYNFGNEVGQSFAPSTGLTPGAASLLEGGPLRARVRAVAAFKNGSSGAQYAVEYELRDGEPFIRITVTGPAPFDPGNMYGQGWAVMARVPFADPARSSVGVPVDGVTRGTPYHWDNELPVPYWTGPTFQAAHGFVVPTHRGTPLGAIYHADVPAWAIDSGGAMIGCLLRNTPSDDGRGAAGIDQGIHRRCYACGFRGA